MFIIHARIVLTENLDMCEYIDKQVSLVCLYLTSFQIDVGLCLVPEQLTASDGGTRIHIRVKMPETNILSGGYLIHAPCGLLDLASTGLDIALGGRRALWNFTWVAQTLGTSVTTGIGPARATT